MMHRLTCCTALLLILGLYSTKGLTDDWTYTTRPGDTLWDICEKYTNQSHCWQTIGAYNNAWYQGELKPGTRIQFPTSWLKFQPKPATVEFVTAGVMAKSTSNGTDEDKAKPILSQSQLTMGTTIIVPEGEAITLRFADGSTMKVSEPSTFTLDRLSSFGATGMADTRIYLKRGAVQVTVPQSKPKTRFQVITPSAIAAVRGTDFRVEYDPKEGGSLRNGVYEGGVDIKNDQGSTNVPVGYGVIAKANQPPADAVKLLPAPIFKSPHSKGSAIMPYSLKWSEISGAKHYSVALSNQTTPNAIIQADVVESNHFTVNHIASGCYIATIQAVDQSKLYGMPAKTNFCVKEERKKTGSFWIFLGLLATALAFSL